MADSVPPPDRNALAGPDAGAAWKAFIDQWSGRLMAIARRHAVTDEDAQDCFLHLCEGLCSDGFARLRTYDPDQGVPFGGWLAVVANRLAVDWQRRQYGRMRMPSAVLALDSFHQRVYELVYRQGLDRSACLEALRITYPRLDEARISGALARLHNALSSRQRWRLSFTNRPPEQRTVSREAGHVMLAGAPIGEYLPEIKTEQSQRASALRAALKQLSAEDRLLLRLRFEQHLSLEQTARIAGLPNLHQARRRIERALEQLRGLLSG
jgi:RNA polymerase sigma factor (sigma-70 family)